MSTVNRPFPPASKVHYTETAFGASVGLCGATLLAREQGTADLARLSCLDCAIRVLAMLQEQQNKLIQTIAKLATKPV